MKDNKNYIRVEESGGMTPDAIEGVIAFVRERLAGDTKRAMVLVCTNEFDEQTEKNEWKIGMSAPACFVPDEIDVANYVYHSMIHHAATVITEESLAASGVEITDERKRENIRFIVDAVKFCPPSITFNHLMKLKENREMPQ